eukprot:778935-Amphidinium_carterae.1
MVNVLSRVTTDPNLEDWYVPMPGPPRPPPPKRSEVNRDMEQAMAIAKAKNASVDTGWASNLMESTVRAKDALNAAKAMNASVDTGWASNLVEATVRAKDAINAAKVSSVMSRREEIELHADGPRPVVKPPPTATPKKPPGPFFLSE